ncbi:hypothetical protein ABTM19_20215, partial [Acinetobacter baumannii]
EEDYKLKEWNTQELTEVFTQLEFKTLGKRILGETYNAFQSAPEGVQTDLFGNAVEEKSAPKKQVVEDNEEERSSGIIAEKNIENTPHKY